MAHKTIERSIRFVYILKLSDGTFYVGQTNDLFARVQEHKDGLQSQTKGKDPKLVFIMAQQGARDEINEMENILTKLNQTSIGRRQIRKMIELNRAYHRLLDLEA